MASLESPALDQLFLAARTHNVWLDRPVADDTLRRIYELARMGPTAANTSPLRMVFVRTHEGKEKLRPALSAGNVDKTMAAPVTAIVAYDSEFYRHMGRLFPVPGRDMKATFEAMPVEQRTQSALMNGSLQGGYVILAARALGLDCGPMGGFDKAKVDALFLTGTTWKSNFLVNLGYGDASKLFPRNPRFDFEEATQLV
jgi:3-hydroxypropanoate dehydrogenase